MKKRKINTYGGQKCVPRIVSHTPVPSIMPSIGWTVDSVYKNGFN